MKLAQAHTTCEAHSHRRSREASDVDKCKEKCKVNHRSKPVPVIE